MMKSNKKFLIATGGTGGHVFPAYSLAQHFSDNNFQIELITDKRGLKYLEESKKIKLKVINTATIYKKNPIYLIKSLATIIFSIVESLIFLSKSKPNLVFGMGGYASFPVCIAAKILRIPFIIYENNILLGKANKYLLPFANKLFLSYAETEGIKKKYINKVYTIGNIIRKNILEYKNLKKKHSSKKINILVLGGSQAAKPFAEKLPDIFKQFDNTDIELKLFQQCMPIQNSKLSEVYKNSKIQYEIFNFSHDILFYFSKADLAITRAGSSMLAELLNCKIPIITIPLPSSAENHQLKNALYFKNKGFSFLVEEHKIEEELFPLIKSIHKDKNLLNQVINKQKNHTDKRVFEKIYSQIKEVINE
jgi:UDP-N-acetylglucosamine--N-acetylmuramyl-(pentapeptide) pyrophosphoryl-undecaprenol N-acetylglucosamine transferase